MKILNYIVIVLLAAFALFTSACSKSSTPEAVAVDFYQAIINDDSKTALKYVGIDDQAKKVFFYGKIIGIFRDNIKMLGISSCRATYIINNGSGKYTVNLELLNKDNVVVDSCMINVYEIDGEYKIR